MMEKYFCNYQQSVELEKLGLKAIPIACWNHPRCEDCEPYFKSSVDGGEYDVVAPMKAEVFEWFRKEYNMFLEIRACEGNEIPRFKGKVAYFAEVNFLVGTVEMENPFKTYEEAESECINKLIEMVKKYKQYE